MLQAELAQSDLPCSGVGHALPQLPQCADEVVVSMHAALQLALPSAQVSEHWPFEQTWPAGQAVPHAPQFDGIARRIHARAVAAGQRRVADDPASAGHASQRAAARVDALLPAAAAVVDVGRRVDAARAARRVAVVTDDAAVSRAHGLSVLGSGALKAAAVAILGVAAERDAFATAHRLSGAARASSGVRAHANVRG